MPDPIEACPEPVERACPEPVERVVVSRVVVQRAPPTPAASQGELPPADPGAAADIPEVSDRRSEVSGEPAPAPEVSDQRSEVSADAADPSVLTSDLRPLISGSQQRDLRGVMEALNCPVRQQILLALASRGPVHVGGLSRRTGISPKTLSHHLGFLRAAGLVFSQRSGKHVEYEPAEGRVRYERHADGRFSLTVTAHGGGVAVTVTVGGSGASDGAQ